MEMVAWKEIEKVCEGVGFPQEAVAELEKTYNRIMGKSAMQFHSTAEGWVNPEADWRKCIWEISVIAKEAGVSLNAARMVLCLYCSIPLYQEYPKRGLPESIYWETLQDLRYKLLECRAFYGEWGTFVPDWYRRFYICERFALGRLQYEAVDFPGDSYKNVLKQGDRVYSCHIPSSGALREEDVIESLKRAYNFYRSELKDGLLPVVCHSWLLYQPLNEVFAESPNIVKFRKMFDVVLNDEDANNGDFWRVFYKEFSVENLQSAPTETKLQKRLKEYLLEGKTMGCGWGVLLFDGEKIINV
ncbi:MAG: DUF5596 domain-containing protein [Clostridia bacterium]|nr:DUF5596 domain-containing protein [Clostridia bacterium]